MNNTLVMSNFDLGFKVPPKVKTKYNQKVYDTYETKPISAECSKALLCLFNSVQCSWCVILSHYFV